MSIILSVAAATAAITLVLVGTVMRSHSRKAKGGQEGIVGERGIAKAAFAQGEEGKVFVHGELWNAVADENVGIGSRVQVVSIDGMTLKVKKI